MATRQSAKNTADPIREIALELAKTALAAGALQRSSLAAKTATDQGRFDAAYVAKLFLDIESRLRATAAAAGTATQK